MSNSKVGALPVLNSAGEISGIVSERDILASITTQKKFDPAALVSSIMTPKPQTLPSYASVARAVYFMVAGGFRHLPVTGITFKDSPAKLGMISVKNVAKYLYQHFGSKITASLDELDTGDDLTQLFSSPLSTLAPHVPVTTQLTTTVRGVVALMNQHHTGSVLVTDETQRLKGIFTERDLITKCLAPAEIRLEIAVQEVMTPRPYTMTENSTLALALCTFAEGRYRHIPVVDDEENLKGILSLRDFIHALTDEVLRELGA
jgi:CBS domain-containing protein